MAWEKDDGLLVLLCLLGNGAEAEDFFAGNVDACVTGLVTRSRTASASTTRKDVYADQGDRDTEWRSRNTPGLLTATVVNPNALSCSPHLNTPESTPVTA